MSKLDVLFLGSSPNALAGAAKLAKAGLRVAVVEAREELGGPITTREIAPGFRADVGLASVAVDPEIARDLGVRVDLATRASATWMSSSPVTLRALDLPPAVGHAVDLLRAIHATPPPSTPRPSPGDPSALGAIARALRGLGARGMHEVLRLSFMSARDYFEETVAHEGARAILCGAAVRAMSEGPFAPGTLFGFLHHEAAFDGVFRSSAKGGAAAFTSALAAAASSSGVEVHRGLGELRLRVEGGVARGAMNTDGRSFDADIVVSDLDARATLTRLVSPSALDAETNRALRALRLRGSVARVHLALRGLPRFTNVDPEDLAGTLVFAPSVASIERAWDAAKRGALAKQPYVEAILPTVADPSLAPEGHHVMDLWVQYVPYGKVDQRKLLDTVLSCIQPFAPDLQRSIVAHRVALPEDLERDFGLSGGHVYGGEVLLSQAFFLRPLPGFAGYQSPIENLYLAGSAAHPGGYSGRSGWNAADAILARKRD